VPRDDSEFKIDTHASYHGLTLKNVTEGAAPNKFLVTKRTKRKSIETKKKFVISANS